MSEALKTGKLTMATKLGYSMGQIGDALAYNIFFIFFFFFLTEVAGVGAVHAGIINLIVIMWDAISDPIIGYLSDNWKSKYGRRRPFILVGAFPLAILIFLCFTAVDFSETGKFIYYTVLAILFWTTYTMVDIPYYSLGAEITQDFDERTRLRIWGSMAIYIAVGIIGFAPLFAALLGGENMQVGWSRVGMVIGAGALLFDLICWNSTRGKEVYIPESERQKKFNVFHTYIQAFKLKPMKYVVGANFFYLLGQAISLGITMHVVMYIAPMTDGQITIFYTSMSVFAIAMLPIINWASAAFGKRMAFVGLIGITAAGIVIFFIVGVYSFSSFLVISAIWSLGNGAFWTLCYSMAYDNTELDEFIHGQRREGLFVSFMSFSQKVGNAFGILMLGMILDFVKYDAALEIQADSAILGMKALFTLWPALFLVLAVILIVFHPLTKTKFKAIEKALEDRRAGLQPDTSGFLDLL